MKEKHVAKTGKMAIHIRQGMFIDGRGNGTPIFHTWREVFHCGLSMAKKASQNKLTRVSVFLWTTGREKLKQLSSRKINDQKY